MKLYFCIILFLVLPIFNVNAQSEVKKDDKIFTYQIGFNATDFIRQYLVLNSNNLNLTASPYMLNFKAFEKFNQDKPQFKAGIRAGFGYDYKNNSSTSNNSSSDLKTKVEKTDYFIGAELQQAVSKRISLFYGVDFYAHNESNRTENIFVNGGTQESAVTLNTLNYKGARFILGFQFNVNAHLNLTTETQFGFKNGQGSTVISGTNFPIPQQDASGIAERFVMLPTFINLNFMF